MTEKRLIDLISRYASDDTPIEENTDIRKDLNISGETASEFIREYSRIFNVDISMFDFEYYFQFDEKDNAYLTVADLNNAIAAGVLEKDVIFSKENKISDRPEFTTKNIITGIIFVIAITALLAMVVIFL